jgi:hypothetical protein
MIKIKITRAGGYVAGDGPCPFDPDKFYLMFASKIIDAQCRGLQELEFSDEQVRQIAAEKKIQLHAMLDDAKTIELPNKTSAVRLLEAVGAALEPEPQGAALDPEPQEF